MSDQSQGTGSWLARGGIVSATVPRGVRLGVGVLVAFAGLLVATGTANAEHDPGERVTISGQTGVPIPGDFNGDGYGDVLFYNAGTKPDPFLRGNSTGFVIDTDEYVVSGAGYTPITGDFDGNGTSDILWYRPGTGADGFWYFTAGTGAVTPVATTIKGTYQVIVSDFDNNSVDDLFWYAPGTGPDGLWFMEADHSFEPVGLTVNGNYTALGGDFDGNGYADIIWYAPGAAADGQWNFQADGSHAAVSRTINGTYKPFAGDFDGNNVDDVFWYAPGAAADGLWSYQTGGSYIATRQSQSGTYVGVAGNYDADPADEIFWAGASTSELWTDPPSTYWWSDTFLGNVTATGEGPRDGYDRDLFEHWIIRSPRTVTPGSSSSTGSPASPPRSTLMTARSMAAAGSPTSTTSPSPRRRACTSITSCRSPRPGTPAPTCWSAAGRRSFANDVAVNYSLVAVTASSNTSKSDSDPAEWKPTNAAAWCRYASEWVAREGPLEPQRRRR